MNVVRIATRGSALALAQARLVAAAIAERGVEHELVIVETEGDRRAPDTAWGEGAFVTAIERALLDGRADIAVHSAKDVPTDEDPALVIAAYLPREDARDALVVAAGTAGRTLNALPAGSVIGTDSPRRTGFLLAHRPDLQVRPLHGNVDTRLRRLDDAEVDALVLAVAGLVRLGRGDRIDERLAPDIVPPAPGQGAIAVQVRAEDEALLGLGRQIDDPPTRLAVETERTFLRAAGGGCRAPIGAHAVETDGEVRLLGGFVSADGRGAVIDSLAGPREAAGKVAHGLVERLNSRRARLGNPTRVLVTRPRDQATALVTEMARRGVEAVVVPAIEIELAGAGSGLDAALRRLEGFDWAVVTSANGARAVAAAAARTGLEAWGVQWAAVGSATAGALRAAGATSVWQPSVARGEALARELPLTPGARALLIRGSLADDSLPNTLRARGAEVEQVVGYVTREAPAASGALLRAAFEGSPPEVVIFASPSAVHGLLRLAGEDLHAAVVGLRAIAIGPTTASAVRAAGISLAAEADTQDAQSLADLAVAVLHAAGTGAPA